MWVGSHVRTRDEGRSQQNQCYSKNIFRFGTNKNQECALFICQSADAECTPCQEVVIYQKHKDTSSKSEASKRPKHIGKVNFASIKCTFLHIMMMKNITTLGFSKNQASSFYSWGNMNILAIPLLWLANFEHIHPNKYVQLIFFFELLASRFSSLSFIFPILFRLKPKKNGTLLQPKLITAKTGTTLFLVPSLCSNRNNFSSEVTP